MCTEFHGYHVSPKLPDFWVPDGEALRRVVRGPCPTPILGLVARRFLSKRLTVKAKLAAGPLEYSSSLPRSKITLLRRAQRTSTVHSAWNPGRSPWNRKGPLNHCARTGRGIWLNSLSLNHILTSSLSCRHLQQASAPGRRHPHLATPTPYPRS